MKQTEILKKFADDMKMYQTVGSAEDREKMLRALESLIEWTEVGHPINISKCKVMNLGHGNLGHGCMMGS